MMVDYDCYTRIWYYKYLGTILCYIIILNEDYVFTNRTLQMRHIPLQGTKVVPEEGTSADILSGQILNSSL